MLKILGLILGAMALLSLACCNGKENLEEQHQDQVHSQNDHIVFHRIVFIPLNVGKTILKSTTKCTFYR